MVSFYHQIECYNGVQWPGWLGEGGGGRLILAVRLRGRHTVFVEARSDSKSGKSMGETLAKHWLAMVHYQMPASTTQLDFAQC